MKRLLLVLIFFAIALSAQAQFENVSTKTIDRLVDKIDKDATLTTTKKVAGDTIISYSSGNNQIQKVSEIIKKDTLTINRSFYYNNKELIFVLESKNQKVNGRLTQVLFSTFYYQKGVRIYKTTKTNNSTTKPDVTPTANLLEIGMMYLEKAKKAMQ